MNRKIEFRGRRKDNGIWVFGYYCRGDFGPEGIQHVIINGNGYKEVDPETVGENTGLHDDDEGHQKLFEGDIAEVEIDEYKHICKIVYEAGGFMFVADSLPDGFIFLSELAEYDQGYGWAEYTKKLGNIYENPELLEENKHG